MDFPRILVLGATGRIGRVLRQCWGGDAALWQARTPQKGPGWALFDPLGDAAALADAAQGVSAILCLSGVTNVRAANGGDMADNTHLARAAIRAAAGSGARVLLASSAAVYGNQPGVLGESTPLAPLSDYGRAKADMEDMAIKTGSDLGVSTCSLRIGNIAGLDAILGGWRPGFQLDRFADGRTPRRSYIGMATLARTLGDLLAAPALPHTLNIALPQLVEMGALLDAADLAWQPRPAPDSAIAEVALDVSALGAFTSVPRAASLPETLVAEWRKLTPA